MEVLTRIRDIRKAKKISQKEMAENLNISQPGYQKIEQGINTLSIDRFLEICNILEINSYNAVLPAVNANVVDEVEKVLMGGALAFDNIHTNCNYSRKKLDELIDKIRSGNFENDALIEELEFVYKFLEIIGRDSASSSYKFRSIKDLIESID